MPIIPNFLGGGGGSGGVKLLPATDIIAQPASEKVYIKWTDPNDIVISGTTFAEWGGTILVRKAGSMPSNRRDGAIILDSKTRNAYEDEWFCDSGLTNGTTYYYKLFPYTTEGIYTDDVADEFTATPATVAPGNVSNISLTAAGNGKLGISWTDPAATVVSNGITVSTWASTKVVVKTGSYATSPNDANAVFTFSSTTRNAYASTQLVATGLTNGTTYYVSFFPISEDGAVNTSTANRKTGVPNRITISTVPSQSGTLTYNGNARTPSWSNYDSTKMTLSVTAQTNAGTYDATVTPNADYCWSDGTTGARTVRWTIGKADLPKPTLSKTSITLDTSVLNDTFTVTRDGDGIVSATSSNTSVATVSVNGETVTVTHVNQTNGNATVTITVGEGTNYKAYADTDVVCNIDAQFIPTVLNNATWAQISEASLAGTASSYWDVGDTKAIPFSGTIGTQRVNTTLYVFILGFDHNMSRESNGAHSIHFGTFMDAQYSGNGVCIIDSTYNTMDGYGTSAFSMNHWGLIDSGGDAEYYATNMGGWISCDLRYDILGSTNVKPYGYPGIRDGYAGYNPANYDISNNPLANTFLSALPKSLRAVMRPITKYTDNSGFEIGATPSACIDYLPLMSEYEVCGTTRYSNELESSYQVQYAYYSSGNSVKKKWDGISRCWWLRSPDSASTTRFLSIDPSYDRSTYSDSRESLGLAPIFMV